jgi:hypothetical protein
MESQKNIRICASENQTGCDGERPSGQERTFAAPSPAGILNPHSRANASASVFGFDALLIEQIGQQCIGQPVTSK